MSDSGPANKARRNMLAAALAAGATAPAMARLISTNSSGLIMAGSLLPQPKQLFQDANWNPLIGGKIYTYVAGSLTPKGTFQDAALTIANTNPTVANARGEVMMFGAGAYRIILKDTAGNTIYDVDNIESAASLVNASIAALAAPAGADLIGYRSVTVKSILDEQFRSRSRGVSVVEAAAANTTAILSGMNAAVAYHSSPLYLDAGKYDTNNLQLPQNGGLIGIDVPRQAQPGNFINDSARVDAGSQLWTTDTNGLTNFVTMGVGSQLKNINFWYPQQTKIDNPSTIVAYPSTIKIGTVGAQNSDNAVIKNVSALNCYNFMDIGDGVNSVGRTIIEDVYVNAFNRGFLIRAQNGDLPMLNRCFVENIFTTNPTDLPNLYNHIRTNAVAYAIDYTQGVNMTDCIALSYGYGLRVTNLTWAQIENCLFDYCSVPFTADGADRVMLSNCTFINNYKPGGPSVVVHGTVRQLSFSNCNMGDYYPSIKTGAFHDHTAGTVDYSSCRFTTRFPAILNCGFGHVEVSACGIGYSDVVGQNISINGGPELVAGVQVPLSSLGVTSPAPAGWTFTTPANVTAIAGGIQIQGAGNNTVNWRPGSASAAENNAMYYSVGMFCLEFDFYVTGQAGSPRMDLLILSDALAIAADAFQLCNDASTSDSGLPERQTFHVSLILPWNISASQLRFNLPGQIATTVTRITNLKISEIVLPRGYTGLEFFAGKTRLPSGYFDPQTGGKIWRHNAPPITGYWNVGDRTIQFIPTVGQPKSWICTVAGAPGTWASEGNL